MCECSCDLRPSAINTGQSTLGDQRPGGHGLAINDSAVNSWAVNGWAIEG
jgi:hypothetical protein